MEENRSEMIESQNQQVVEQKDSEKLTTGEKLIVAGSVGGIALLGYLLGTYVVAPIVTNAKHAAEEMKADKDAQRRGKKRSRSGVEYDDDAIFMEFDDDDQEEGEKK